MVKRINISKKHLEKLYLKEKLTTFQIADKLKCCQATVWKRLGEFKIKPRLPGSKRVKIPKEVLRELYLNKKLSSWKIEKKLKIPRSTVHRKLRELGINKDRATSHIIYPRKNFSGDFIEKSYLIGFRIGDLRARKQYKNSKTICLACSSTIPEQIELINNLFSKYGRVWIKKSNDKKVIHSEVYLDESFNYLLSKKIPGFVLRNKKCFFSFLAGFVDAEGHIGIYRNMARFSLGNYDSKLLFIIYKMLNKYKIEGKQPISDKRKGKVNSQGYESRNNYWHLRIHKKNELMDLFKKIKPYLKHKNKIKDLNKAIENINQRNKKKYGTKNDKNILYNYCN